MERETRVAEEQDLPFELDGDPTIIDADDRDGLFQLLADAAATLRIAGGSVQLTAIRRELAPNIFVPTEYVLRWNSFMPAVQGQANGNGKAEPVGAESSE